MHTFGEFDEQPKAQGKTLWLSGKIARGVKKDRSFQGPPRTREQQLELVQDDCLVMGPRLLNKPVIMNHGQNTGAFADPEQLATIVGSRFDESTGDWHIR